MKKFNAKREIVKATYEFLDGTETTLTIQSPSTAEYEQIDIGNKEGRTTREINESFLRVLLAKNEVTIIDKVIKEQYEEGLVGEFTDALYAVVKEAKEGKYKD